MRRPRLRRRRRALARRPGRGRRRRPRRRPPVAGPRGPGQGRRAAETAWTAARRAPATRTLGGWVVEGDWAVVAETDEHRRRRSPTRPRTARSPTTTTYQHWTDEAGDPGIMSMYAAPEAGQFLADMVGTFGGGGMLPGMPMDAHDGSRGRAPTRPAVPEEMTEALEDFQGMAATLRFDDGALEFEVAGDAGTEDQMQMFATDRGDDVVDRAARGHRGRARLRLRRRLVRRPRSSRSRDRLGGEMTVEDMEAELEASTGLTVDDARDPGRRVGRRSRWAATSTRRPSSTPPTAATSRSAPRSQGDADEIQDVLDKLARRSAAPRRPARAPTPTATWSRSARTPTTAGSCSRTAASVTPTSSRTSCARPSDADAILFVNFDAGTGSPASPRTTRRSRDNLEPLDGLGFSSWIDDDTSHAVFRLPRTTDGSADVVTGRSGPVIAPVIATRSAGLISRSSPRRPADTKTVGWSSADSSSDGRVRSLLADRARCRRRRTRWPARPRRPRPSRPCCRPAPGPAP